MRQLLAQQLSGHSRQWHTESKGACQPCARCPTPQNRSSQSDSLAGSRASKSSLRAQPSVLKAPAKLRGRCHTRSILQTTSQSEGFKIKFCNRASMTCGGSTQAPPKQGGDQQCNRHRVTTHSGSIPAPPIQVRGRLGWMAPLPLAEVAGPLPARLRPCRQAACSPPRLEVPPGCEPCLSWVGAGASGTGNRGAVGLTLGEAGTEGLAVCT